MANGNQKGRGFLDMFQDAMKRQFPAAKAEYWFDKPADGQADPQDDQQIWGGEESAITPLAGNHPQRQEESPLGGEWQTPKAKGDLPDYLQKKLDYLKATGGLFLRDPHSPRAALERGYPLHRAFGWSTDAGNQPDFPNQQTPEPAPDAPDKPFTWPPMSDLFDPWLKELQNAAAKQPPPARRPSLADAGRQILLRKLAGSLAQSGPSPDQPPDIGNTEIQPAPPLMAGLPSALPNQPAPPQVNSHQASQKGRGFLDKFQDAMKRQLPAAKAEYWLDPAGRQPVQQAVPQTTPGTNVGQQPPASLIEQFLKATASGNETHQAISGWLRSQTGTGPQPAPHVLNWLQGPEPQQLLNRYLNQEQRGLLAKFQSPGASNQANQGNQSTAGTRPATGAQQAGQNASPSAGRGINQQQQPPQTSQKSRGLVDEVREAKDKIQQGLMTKLENAFETAPSPPPQLSQAPRPPSISLKDMLQLSRTSRVISTQGLNSLIGDETIGHRPNLTVYPDTRGNPTIGYGHEVKRGENFTKGITPKQAKDLLDKDIRDASRFVNSQLHVWIPQSQFDALVSVAYNGGGRVSSLIAKINNLETPSTQDFIDTLSKRDQADPAMVARRKREAAIFQSGDYGNSQR